MPGVPPRTGAVAVPFFCSDDPINLLTIPVPFFPVEAGHPPCASRASTPANPPGPSLLPGSLHPSGPQSPYTKEQAPVSASGWPPGACGTGSWAPQQGARGLALPLPFHRVSLGFLCGCVSVFIPAKCFLFAIYSLNRVLGIYLFIFIFSKSKSFASHNRVPRHECPGLVSLIARL